MNFSKALQPYNTAAFADVEITKDVFSIKICEDNIESQQYMARIAEYAAACSSKHDVFSPDKDKRNKFYDDKTKGNLTKPVMEYLLNVIIVDWTLKDDDGKTVEFTEKALSNMFLSEDEGQRNATDRIARKLLNASIAPMFFSQDVLKNS